MTLTATSSTAAAYVRPQSGESAPYYERYISLVPGNDVLAAFDDQRRQMLLLLSGRTEGDGDLRYAADKWSLKEVLGHVNDTERIMSYRALRIARGDTTPIEGFEQDDYVRNGPFARRPLSDLIEDYIAVRRATVSLFRNLDEPAWSDGAGPRLHNRRTRVASSPNNRREVFKVGGETGVPSASSGQALTRPPKPRRRRLTLRPRT